MAGPFRYRDDRGGRKWRLSLPPLHRERPDNLEQAVAKLLADGKIVGWFEGRSEIGPRALGHRSILADPRSAQMQQILNDKVKHRQWFRPFAPAILEESCSKYFRLDVPSPHMLLVADVVPEKRDVIPAVIHVDDTARVQTVAPGSGSFRRIIEEFFALTGVPVILNTSFNDHGEPIVETPLDALACFTGTFMDALAVAPYLITKEAEVG